MALLGRIAAVLAKIRKPYAFLAAAVAVSLLSLLSPFAGVVLGALVILIFFPIKFSIALACLYLLFQYNSFNSAYVTDIEYSGKNTIVFTTKGRFKSTDFQGENVFATGDRISCGFKKEVDLSGNVPRLRHMPEGEVKTRRVPVVSSLLALRQEQTKRMFLRSGGKIHVAPAHIFATRDQIPHKLEDQYIITGLAHLVAMSGFNVAIFTAGIFLLFAFLPKRLRVIPAIIVLPFLIPLSGFAVTVQRAVVLAVISLLAWFMGMRVLSVKFLAFLASCMILLQPFALFSISFLLSFFAVLGMITMFQQRFTLAKGVITMGVASTVFTLPLQLHFFGNANLLSIVTTLLFTPVVWAQMFFGLLAVAFGDIMIAPLTHIEIFSEWFIEQISKFSWHFMFISKPPLKIIVISFAAALALLFTRFRPLSMLIFLLPLLPVYPNNILYFPALPPSPKGYILKSDEGTEIFYQGMRSSFVYTVVPAAAELGIKSFDRGIIRIFDAENLYLRIKEPGLSGKICVNEQTDSCEYVYMTRSNTIKAPLRDSIKQYIIYNNAFEDPKIWIQKQAGELKLPLEQK